MPAETKGGAQDIASRRDIYYQAFGIYKELAGFYNYGPIGLHIKRNIESAWRRIFVSDTGAIEVDTTDIVSEPVLTASGHIATFTDPIITCQTCEQPFRADKLVEEYMEKHGMAEDAKKVKKENVQQLEEDIARLGIKCERCGNKKFSKIERFNLLFKTMVGPTGKETAYLRPETCQAIFMDFYELYKTQGLKLPALIAQSGRSFRNEISPRQQLVRMRELNQMDLEVFIDPDDVPEEIGIYNIKEMLGESIPFARGVDAKPEPRKLSELLESKEIPNRYFAFLLCLEKKLLVKLGIKEGTYLFRALEPEELPHYSKGNVDLEINTSYGYIETCGNAYRTDYDLSSHSKLSGKDLSVICNEKRVLAHVVEASMGLDRMLLALLDNSFEKGEERGWNWLRLSEIAAPYKYGVFPLQKDDKLLDKANALFKLLKERGVDCYYAQSGSIGKRYAKADEIGVPYCITIDYTTLEDDTVTVRDRDTAQQVRKGIAEIL